MIALLLAQSIELTVAAHDKPRRWAVAEWTAPEGAWRLKDVPCQREGSTVRWLIADLPASEARTYTLSRAEAEPDTPALKEEDGVIAIRKVARYHFGEKVLHPSFDPLVAHGVGVTRGLDERGDHPHHTSVWFAHGDVNGRDYWSKLPIRHSRFIARAAGPVYARIASENAWGEDIVESRDVRIYDAGDDVVMDWTITLTAAADVTLGRTKEGGFAVRVAERLTEKKGGVMVTSDGRRGEAECRSKPAAWCDFSDGKVGVAILNHPDGWRAPADWHVRGYGLLAASHLIAKEPHKLAKGESITLRYRIYAHAGDAAGGKVADVYEAVAHPPRVARK